MTLLMRSEFQAVPAKLEYVNRKGGIRAGITVNADANCRHALFDASGSQVLVVIADPKRWAARMDEIKAKDDQLELFDPSANYDPKVDQPGYRRDQDPFIKAGKSWADLKSSFGVGDAAKPPEGGAVPAFEPLLPDGAPRCLCGVEKTDIQCGLPRDHEGEHKLTQFGAGDSDLPEDQARLVAQRILQEQLAEAGVVVSLGALQAATEEQQNEARAWVETYLTDPKACTIERPAWLPAPNIGEA